MSCYEEILIIIQRNYLHRIKVTVRAIQPLRPAGKLSNPPFLCTLCKSCTPSITELRLLSVPSYFGSALVGQEPFREGNQITLFLFVQVCAEPAARELLPPADQFLHYVRLQFYIAHSALVCLTCFFIDIKKCISKVLIQIIIN